MKTSPAVLLTSAFAVLMLVSCKKEDAPPKSELFTTGAWRITSFVMIQGSSTYEHYTNMYACEKDDYLVFKKDGVLEFNAGASKCDEDQAQVYTATWLLTEGETKIIMDGETATLLSLTASELTISALIETRNGPATSKKTYTNFRVVNND